MPERNNLWLFYAIVSGACAALNGAFAKLTTTQLTATWANAITTLLNLPDAKGWIEVAVRGFFFGLNLTFNGVMWGLFTRALTLATSTVRVSVINTSANFMITAVLGWMIFGETLPGLWWLGAAFLVTGSVIIGRRDEGKETDDAGSTLKEGQSAKDESQPTKVTQTGYEATRSDDNAELKQRPAAQRRTN